MDYDIHRASRHCAATGRELAEGETFYSVLMPDKQGWQRLDYSAQAWAGPPEGALGWWQARMPSRESKRAQLAPNDVLLEYFLDLARQPAEADAQYVLALLLVRRRVLRLEDTETDAAGRNVLVLYNPRDEATYRVNERTLDENQTAEIQARLSQLLFANAS
ncbi:MAG: hypothetical protein JNG90_09800 [Planctomycetaceae bacterium]|nr:hypothetical protein [Planctomycetaceae bacterium]